MKFNLLWPTWARVVAQLPFARVEARGLECWHSVKRAALLMVDQVERKQRARFYRGESAALEVPEIAVRRVGLSLLRRRCGFVWLALPVLAALASSPVSAQESESEPEKESKLFRVLGFALYGVSAGDAISTELALSNGGRELNPLQRNRAVRIASHAASPVSINHSTAKLYRDGRTKTALWLRIAVVGVYGFATAHNLRQWQR